MLERLARVATFFLNVSGGRDSAAAAARAVEALRGVNPGARVYAVYAHTPLALEENLRYVERLAGWLGVELIVVRPPPERGLRLLSRSGWPHPLNRWCMHQWKVQPIFEAASRYPRPHVHVLGIRLGESRRRYTLFSARGELGFHSGRGVWYWLPILRWSREQVERYIEERGIPRNPLWGERGHSSHDCVVCLPYATWREYAWLKASHPDKFQELLEAYRELQRNKRKKGKVLAWGYTDLEAVAKQATLEQYLAPNPKRNCGCLLPGATPAGQAPRGLAVGRVGSPRARSFGGRWRRTSSRTRSAGPT